VASELKVPGFAGGDYRGMLEKHPEIEAVFIATPDDDHLGPLEAAVAAGVQVCMEKPLAVDVGEAHEMVRLVREAGLMMMMCHTLRFDPRYVAMREAVVRGEIGPVSHIYARRNVPSDRVTRTRGRVNVAFWVGVHDIDMMHWVTGGRVVSVVSKKAEGFHSQAFGVEDCMLSLLTFENGIVASLENSWVCTPVVGRPMAAQFEVRGPAGIIDVATHEQGVGIYKGDVAVYPDTQYAPVLHGRITGVYRDQIAHFIECVASGAEPVVTGEDGLAAVVVADALNRSVAEGREITL
jgi:predicted dehydrogenase